MNILDGIKNFLNLINDNWTSIIVIIGLCVVIKNKFSFTNHQRCLIKLVVEMSSDVANKYKILLA